MDAKAVRGHVHVADGHEGTAHIDPNGRALIRVIVIVVAHVADIS